MRKFEFNVSNNKINRAEIITAQVMKILPWIAKRYDAPMQKITVGYKNNPFLKKACVTIIIES